MIGFKCRFSIFLGVLFMCVTVLGSSVAVAENPLDVFRGSSTATAHPDRKMAVFARDHIRIKKADGEVLHFDVELAETPEQQQQGMMFRTEMADNAGMLFLFSDVSLRNFWMKNTLIPLDMLFINSDGTIHHIHHNAKPQDLSQITSKFPSLAVLEVNGGLSGRMGIGVGDVILHPVFKNMHLQ